MTETSFTFRNLVPGDSVYFAVTATDSSGNESELSKEVWMYIPIPDIVPTDSLLIEDTTAPLKPSIFRTVKIEGIDEIDIGFSK